MGWWGPAVEFSVGRGVLVPDAYTWRFGPDMPRGPHYQGPLYRFPLVGLFRLPVSAVALGIAQGAIEACLALAPAKRAGRDGDAPRPAVLPGPDRGSGGLGARGLAWLHTAVQQAWASTLTSGTASVAERADLLLAAVHATRSAAEAVQLVYTVAGGRRIIAAVRSNVRCAMSTVTQHIGTAPQQYEEAGRMVLGLEPLQPIVLVRARRQAGDWDHAPSLAQTACSPTDGPPPTGTVIGNTRSKVYHEPACGLREGGSPEPRHIPEPRGGGASRYRRARNCP